MKNIILCMLAVFALNSCADQKDSNIGSGSPAEPIINGAWEVTHIEKKNADTSIVQNPWYKSIYIYSDKYFSIAAATEERPSAPERKKGEKIDPEYFANAYLRYISNSGTYEILGDSIIHNVIVAKSPTVMNKKRRTSEHLSLEKDKMFLSSTKGNITTILTLERLNQ